MALQNRVTPNGEIVSYEARGEWMGNRGCLHDAAGRLTGRKWARLAWVTCTLTRKNIRRVLMSPGRYTELFFLDEPTALAAGHRPCAECRRDEYTDFLRAFSAAQGSARLTAAAMDARLHQDRIEGAHQGTFEADLEALPDGVIVEFDDSPLLWWRNRLLRWQPEGYANEAVPQHGKVKVLTPACTVAALRQGYSPRPHASAPK